MISNDRFNYAPYIISSKDTIKKRGYIRNPGKRFTKGSSTFTIPVQFQYRPDLISRYLYGTPKYAWLLAYINGFKDSPKDFYTGRIINIVRKESLNS